MAITSIKRDFDSPSIIRLFSTDTISAIGTSGYLTAQDANIEAINNGPFEWEISDMVLVYSTTDAAWEIYTISPDFTSLTPFAFTESVIGIPVQNGNFAVFSGTQGQLKDGSYLPTDPAKTRVVMLNATPISGNIAKFTNANGTIGDAGFSLLAKTTAAFAGGSPSNAYAATGLTASSIVVASILNSTSAVTIVKVVPSTDTLTITFSSDPGAATTVSYIAITPAV